ncbi:MAG TPA: DUF4244 domain-containing protein [Marmoricola sp.]|nr:DUF4244 domain-containing protein [Marmoricola sp.]
MTTKTLAAARDEVGATAAEYAVCTGAGVGIAGVLFKFLTSGAGQQLIKTVFDHVIGLLPF